MTRQQRSRPVKRKLFPAARPMARKKAKRAAPKRVKTGAYAGSIIAAKPVPMTKRCVRIRERLFNETGGISAARRIWVGGNTIGDEQYVFSLFAEAVLEHLLSKTGDTRSDKERPNAAGILKEMNITFTKDENRLTSTTFANESPPTRSMRYVVEAESSSFNGIVYNNIVGATPNLVYLDGSASASTQRGLRDVLFDMALSGYYPEQLFAFRTGFPAGGDPPVLGNNIHEIYRDTQFGKASLKMTIGGVHKFQNITPADHGTTNEGYNANAIDANPLQGKIYTFSKLAPTWNKGWLADQTSGTQVTLNLFSGRPYSRNQWDYKMIGTAADTATDGIVLPNLNEFKLPPLRPRSIFSNVKTSGRVSIPPGGFKTFSTKFSYVGSISRFARDITQQNSYEPVSGRPEISTGKFPSLGDSFMMCLTPAMTSSGESVNLAFDYQKDGQAYIKKYTMGTMPTTNIVPQGGPAPDDITDTYPGPYTATPTTSGNNYWEWTITDSAGAQPPYGVRATIEKIYSYPPAVYQAVTATANGSPETGLIWVTNSGTPSPTFSPNYGTFRKPYP